MHACVQYQYETLSHCRENDINDTFVTPGDTNEKDVYDKSDLKDTSDNVPIDINGLKASIG